MSIDILFLARPAPPGFLFGRERSDLEASKAGEEQATARCRVGNTGPQA